MDDIENLTKQYFEIKQQMNFLEKKSKEIREMLLGYLIINNNKMTIHNYRIWFTEIPRYDYSVKDIYSLLKLFNHKNEFFEIININSKNFQNLLLSNNLSENSVNHLLNYRTVKSSSKSLYIKEIK